MWCWIRSEGPRAQANLCVTSIVLPPQMVMTAFIPCRSKGLYEDRMQSNLTCVRCRTWDGVMSVPRHVPWDAARRKLRTMPVQELELLRTNGGKPLASTVGTLLPPLGGLVSFTDLGQSLDIEATFTVNASAIGRQPRQSVGVRVLVDNTRTTKTSCEIRIDFAVTGTLIPPWNKSAVVWIDMTRFSNISKGRAQAPLDLGTTHGQQDGILRIPLRIMVDRGVTEVFAQDGVSVLSQITFAPSLRSTGVEIFAQGIGSFTNVTANVYGMGSAIR